jgi:hypothetical protein
VLSLQAKYSDQRLERACSIILSHTPSPTYQQLKNILDKKMDVLEQSTPKKSTNNLPKRGFQRGAGYFGGEGHA